MKRKEEKSRAKSSFFFRSTVDSAASVIFFFSSAFQSRMTWQDPGLAGWLSLWVDATTTGLFLLMLVIHQSVTQKRETNKPEREMYRKHQSNKEREL